MKIIKLLTFSILLYAGIQTSTAQQQKVYSEKFLNMIAPEVTDSSVTQEAKLDSNPFDDMIQVITTPAERGPSGSGSSNSPTAAPGNNDCTNATTLTVNAACVTGTNKEATVQTGESTACQGTVTKTVWYKFTATATSMFVEVERTASSGCYLSSSVFNGNCLPTSVISCEDAAGGPNLNIHNLTGLNINATYYVQVSYTAGGPCGNNNNANTGADFCIKAGITQSCNTCNTTCGPVCVFPTTPTVAQVTSTCPAYDLKPRMNSGQSRTQCYTFTATSSSFSLQMIINSAGCGPGGNVSTFNWQVYPASCAAAIQSGTLSNLNASGLTPGTNYVLCYTWVSTCQHNTVYPYIVATTPLPVQLLNFDGRQLEKTIHLNWNTATETGNSHFVILRSADGINFQEIGLQKGAGNSSQTQSYEFIDNEPVKGINYFKLAQHDFDGKVEYSDVIAVKYFENSFIKIESNPVGDELNVIVQSEKVEYVTFRVVNNFGEILSKTSKFTAKGFNKFTIPVEGITKGSYFLKMEALSKTAWAKFIKL